MATLVERGRLANHQRAPAERTLEFLFAHLPPATDEDSTAYYSPSCSRRIGTIRKGIWQNLDLVRNHVAREWIQRRLRIIPGKLPIWARELRVKAALQDFDKASATTMAFEELGRLSELTGMEVVYAPWRLPVWTTQKSLKDHTVRSWCQWGNRIRLHTRVIADGTASWHKRLQHPLPEPPSRWKEFEDGIRAAVSDARVLVPDDRNQQNAWPLQCDQLPWHLLAQIVHDSLWVIRPDLEPDGVLAWMHARTFVGLPGFLRRWDAPSRGRVISPPSLFAFCEQQMI